jgi:hypothetical protein
MTGFVRKSAATAAIIASLAVSPLGVPALAQPARLTVGVAAAVVNEVKVGNAAVPQFRPVVLRDRLALADIIQTGRRSHLQVLLLDRAVFTVGSNARLTIDRFIYDPVTGRSFTASVAKGAFRFLLGQRNPRRDTTVKTPIASIGIRGTVIEGVVGPEAVRIARAERLIDRRTRVDPEVATLVVLRGPGAQTQGGLESGYAEVTGGGQTVRLDRPSMAVFIGSADAAPIESFMISRKGLQRVQEQVFPAWSQWRSSGKWRRLRSIRLDSTPSMMPRFEMDY